MRDALLKLVACAHQAAAQCDKRLVDREHSAAMADLRATLDTINQGIVLVDATGTVQLCNARAAEFFRLPDGLIGQSLDLRRLTAELLEADFTVSGSGRTATLYRPGGDVFDLHIEPRADGGTTILVEDVTANFRREESLHLAESEYLSLFENAVCGIYRDKPDGTPLRANRALVAFNGYESEQQYRTAVKQSGGNWYVDPDRTKLFQHLLTTTGEVRDLVSEVYRHRTREKRWITENAWYVRNKAGVPIYIEGTIQDATERVEGLAAVEQQANTDQLTGAASRFHFLNTLNAITRDANGACVLFIVDLDKFKDVNDALGHGAGDAVLSTVAQRLRKLAGPAATVARLGGDEFAIITPGTSASMQADMKCADIVRAMREPIEIEGHNAIVGASVGVAIFPAHAATTEELLNNADIALYHVKTNGRNNACIFDHAMKLRLQQHKALEADLRSAIPADALELYYQPIVAAKTGSVLGYEALMRWNHPRRGFLPPDQFIGIAEDAGLMTELGNWAIRRACQQAVALPGHISIAVNVSPSQFRSSGIVEQVKRALGDTGLNASRLVLEVTENVLMTSQSIATRVMDDLTALGVKLALDDFGTGYSSLSYLQRYAFSKVKIDRSFVAGIESKPANTAIIRAIIRLAADLGMDVVAEGIESEHQAALLRAEGCELLQGYLFGRPRPFVDICADLALHNLQTCMPQRPLGTLQDAPEERTVHKTL